MLLAKKFEEIQASTEKEITEIAVTDLIGEFGDAIFGHLTDLFNFIFEYKNDDYEAVSAEWIKEELPIRYLMIILEEIASQNQMDWLIPFFQERFLRGVREMAAGKPIQIEE